ncbi:MAG: hypothetical protein FWG66_02840 [Spirochaetes bacterium]|nr:hypothetical protein [Spirochaetota bacterium]
MKAVDTKSASLFIFLTGFALALLASCNNDQLTEDLPEGHTVAVSAASGTRYFSLNPFREITGAEINTAAWDIAFSTDRTILTNSGTTAQALGSGGQGGVWHTESFNLGAVAVSDRVTTGGFARNADSLAFIAGMGPPAQRTVNVMSHLGWQAGDGASAASAYSANPLTAVFINHARAFVTAPAGMPPAFAVTNRVYIVRHGSGQGYSAVQISGYVFDMAGGNETYHLLFRNF